MCRLIILIHCSSISRSSCFKWIVLVISPRHLSLHDPFSKLEYLDIDNSTFHSSVQQNYRTPARNRKSETNADDDHHLQICKVSQTPSPSPSPARRQALLTETLAVHPTVPESTRLYFTSSRFTRKSTSLLIYPPSRLFTGAMDRRLGRRCMDV